MCKLHCVEFDTRGLFSHESAELGQFSSAACSLFDLFMWKHEASSAHEVGGGGS